ncbi:MAG: hypothetical protein ACI8VC_001310 [Candidatus Endobugula sp.]|jgi:hypothetical protein
MINKDSSDDSITDGEIVEGSAVVDKTTDDHAEPKKSSDRASVSNDQTNALKARLLSRDHWLRFVFMMLFAVIASVAAYVAAVLILIQFVFALVTGSSETRLQSFGGQLSQYLFQILQFLTYNKEQKPFPFSDWPNDDLNNDVN